MIIHQERRAVFEALDLLLDKEWRDVLDILLLEAEALRMMISDSAIENLLRAVRAAQQHANDLAGPAKHPELQRPSTREIRDAQKS